MHLLTQQTVQLALELQPKHRGGKALTRGMEHARVHRGVRVVRRPVHLLLHFTAPGVNIGLEGGAVLARVDQTGSAAARILLILELLPESVGVLPLLVLLELTIVFREQAADLLLLWHNHVSLGLGPNMQNLLSGEVALPGVFVLVHILTVQRRLHDVANIEHLLDRLFHTEPLFQRGLAAFSDPLLLLRLLLLVVDLLRQLWIQRKRKLHAHLALLELPAKVGAVTGVVVHVSTVLQILGAAELVLPVLRVQDHVDFDPILLLFISCGLVLGAGPLGAVRVKMQGCGLRRPFEQLRIVMEPFE
mmetsp:Transcript_75235/g.213972  ORF Transcript_75235/g.213972 Transcript_75235/m.213972 type:complete len:304 (+) Transcript_75235:1924-2835(+)